LWVFCLALTVGAAAAASASTPVIVAPARVVAFEDRIEALGTLKANESVVLTASVTETVTRLNFDDGDRVAEGVILAEMTSAEEQALLREAEALAAEAERQYRRVQSLAQQGTASKSLLDERQREWQTARARLVAIDSRLSDRVIRAPFAGVVGLRDISVGALVEPGDVITTLDDDRVMKLDLSIPSVFLADVAPGMAIAASSRVYPERRFAGTVRTIDTRVDPVTRAIVVRATLPNPERLLKPGMLMQVTLSKDPRQALVIPEAALMPLGRDQSVLVAVPEGEGHKAAKRPVTIGSRRAGEVEVTGGLEEGELVITHGTQRARPGQAVTVRAVDRDGAPLEQLLQQQASEAGKTP
jgi:membrane fusion protein (multidrug efflux system)